MLKHRLKKNRNRIRSQGLGLGGSTIINCDDIIGIGELFTTTTTTTTTLSSSSTSSPINIITTATSSLIDINNCTKYRNSLQLSQQRLRNLQLSSSLSSSSSSSSPAVATKTNAMGNTSSKNYDNSSLLKFGGCFGNNNNNDNNNKKNDEYKNSGLKNNTKRSSSTGGILTSIKLKTTQSSSLQCQSDDDIFYDNLERSPQQQYFPYTLISSTSATSVNDTITTTTTTTTSSSSNKICQQKIHLIPRRRISSINPSLLIDDTCTESYLQRHHSNADVMRRCKSLRGECHPNRFRRHRKTSTISTTTTTTTNPTTTNQQRDRIKKLNYNYISGNDQRFVTDFTNTNNQIDCISNSINYNRNGGGSSGCVSIGGSGRNSVSYIKNPVYSEDSEIILKNWNLRRGKSLSDYNDDKNNSIIYIDDDLDIDNRKSCSSSSSVVVGSGVCNIDDGGDDNNFDQIIDFISDDNNYCEDDIKMKNTKTNNNENNDNDNNDDDYDEFNFTVDCGDYGGHYSRGAFKKTNKNNDQAKKSLTVSFDNENLKDISKMNIDDGDNDNDTTTTTTTTTTDETNSVTSNVETTTLPIACFGKRNGGSARRSNECFVLETSEMIVIEYPEVSIQSTNIINPYYHVLSLSPSKQQQQQQYQPVLSHKNNISKIGGQEESDIKSPIISTELLSTNLNNCGIGSIENNNSVSSSSPAAGTIYKQNLKGQNLFGSTTITVTGSTISQPIFTQSTFDNSIIITPSSSNSSILYHRNSTPAAINSCSGTTICSTHLSSGHRQQFNINMDPHHIRHSVFPGNRPELYQKCNRGSHSSDTSSAYSGSDTMTSVHSSSLDVDEVDLSNLQESVVDSDEEDLAESMDSLNVRDAVRECLEKDPSERTEDDIETLLEFTQGLKAFTNMTLAVRRALCSVMVFAVVDKAKTMVMNDGEELDSWSVLINGHVEIEHNNSNDKEELQVGDSFGILPTMDKLYHRGVMRTKCDDCQFVCITQNDYYRIQHQGEENTKRHEENGNVVMVTELRQIGPDITTTAISSSSTTTIQQSLTTNLSTTTTIPQQQQQQQTIQLPLTTLRRGHVVIRGTADRLLLQLIEENSITDPTYVEDFLLTHRTFILSSKEVAKQLLKWFENESTLPKYTIQATSTEIRDRVTRVILLWVNNHFTDFETDTEMMEFLEIFENGLEKKQMPGQLRLLHIACAAKARTRTITLARSSRDENLHFQIIGGYEYGNYGIFILQVDKKTKPDDVGLKRGDQILEVNGQSFEHVTYIRALEILMGSTHLSITVRSNLLSFKDMLQILSDIKNSPKSRQNNHRRRIYPNDIAKLNLTKITDPLITSRLSTVDLLLSSSSSLLNNDNDQVDCTINQSPFKDLSNINNSSNNSIINNSGANNFVMNLLSNSGRKDISLVSNTSSNTSIQSSSTNNGGQTHKGGFMTLGPKRRLQKALIKMNLLPKNSNVIAGSSSNCNNTINILSQQQTNDDDHSSTSSSVIGSDSTGITTTNSALIFGSRSGSCTNNILNNNNNNNQTSSGLYQSHSNPDLTTISSSSSSILQQQINSSSSGGTTTLYYEDNRQLDYPEHVLKVYKSDQTCKYLLINKETTAHEVVMLALQEFGIHETSSNFSLCEVSVGDGGMIKQRRLPEQLQNLAERIGLCSRYYLKTNGITETLVPDDLAPDLVRESTVHFLQLNANEVSIQLTFQDFGIFRQIESTEYVDDLFNIKSKYGIPMLRQFSELVNREMFWVVTEVCTENNMVRRMKIIKQFIKIARHCKECRNFNSMFAIISGLGHVAVSRLRQTWEKLPNKYQKLFNDLQDLMDPSRNMSKYRQLVTAELLAQNPLIPFYPVVKKDLTFIHLGNDTRVENLINFEKLRMIAKEVRLLTHMCSSTYDLLTMLEFKGQPPSSAMVALNQMSVSTGQNCIGGSSTSTISHNLLHPGNSATVKRRKKSTAAPNPKKMFEEAQMVRRVKAYLNNMKVITDEDLLHNLSLECEPSTNTGHGSSISGGNSAPNTVTIRKRHPSPTLSTTSSTSSTSEGKRSGIINSGNCGGNNNSGGPKFGTASPQAVKKILSLSETTKTRPHQPRHPGIPLPLVGHPHALHHSLHSSISPSPSPGAHRRMGSSSSVGTGASGIIGLNAGGIIGNVVGNNSNIIGSTCTPRAIHERSHSDTPTPLPSVDLSAESSSVTSLSNLPLRKNITSGSITSSDSGHGSCVQADTYSNCSDGGSSGLYHVASSIVHNSPSPTLQQRRHSSIHASTGLYICANNTTSSSTPSPNGSIGINNFSNTSSPPPPPIPPHHPLNSMLPPLPPPPLSSSSSSSGSSTSVVSSSLTTTSLILDNNIGLPLLQHQQQSQPKHLNLNQSSFNKQNSHGLLIGGNNVNTGIGNNSGLNIRNFQLHQQIQEHIQQQQQQHQKQHQTIQNNHLQHNSMTQQSQIPSLYNNSSTITTTTTATTATIVGGTKNTIGVINDNCSSVVNNSSCNSNNGSIVIGVLSTCNNNNINNLYAQQQHNQQQNLHNQTNAIQYHTGRNTGHGLMAPPPPKGPRHPPAYSVAAQMARLHRLGRAHSHEGVSSSSSSSSSVPITNNSTIASTTGIGISSNNSSSSGVGGDGVVSVSSGAYYHTGPEDEDDDEGAQVSAV